MKTDKEYIKDPNHCPYCSSDNLEAGHFDPEGLVVPVTCNSCHKSWTELYKLVGIAPEIE
jgi:transposase-like protein